MSAERMPMSRGVTRLADIPDGERRDGGPELVIRGKHPVIPVPVLPRRRHEIGHTIEKFKRRELDDAVRPRPRGRAAAAGPDPVGRLMSRQHVADAGDPAVWAADHGESLEGEGRTGTVSQQVLKTLKIAGHIAVEERDPNTRVYRKPAVLPSEHLGGGRGVEQPLHAEPPDHAATHSLCERCQLDVRDRPGR